VIVRGGTVSYSGVYLESTTEFTVDAGSVAPRGGGKVKAFVTAPSATRTEALVNNNNDGTYKCMYTPYEQGTGHALIASSHIGPVPTRTSPAHVVQWSNHLCAMCSRA